MSQIPLPAILFGIISVLVIAGTVSKKSCYFMTKTLATTSKNYRLFFQWDLQLSTLNSSSIFVFNPSMLSL